MAWPCITRACCINRFWSELDKGDIAVPLVFTRYSHVADEHQHLQPRPQPQHPPPPAAQARVAIETQPAAAASAPAESASVMRQDYRAWKVRPERSCKPRSEYQPSAAPFIDETQYQKDFKPWPIPRKHDHPWIPKAGPSLAPEGDSGAEKGQLVDKVQEKESKERKQMKGEKVMGRAAADALNMQIKQEVSVGTSYRNEFRAYTDVKPVKPIKARSQYKPAVEEKVSLETSYSATFRGEHLATDNKMMEHRRIRTLYSEPGKDVAKAEKLSSPRSKPKKVSTTSTGHSKPVKKAKEKQSSAARSTKKKPSEKCPESTAASGNKEEKKQLNNKLAEAKE